MAEEGKGRLLIAAGSSGAGKTTVTCGLLTAFQRRGLSLAACKCGPDYIDPMFHRQVLGVPSRNLDLFLCGEEAVMALLAESCECAELTLIEGVMGFYDGLNWTDEASSHHLSRVTNIPVLLVADCRGRSVTLAAELRGIVDFAPNNIAGILLNRCAQGSYPKLKELVEKHTGLPVVGYLPTVKEVELESRHLGLVTAGEVENLRGKLDLLADQLERTVELDRLLEIACSAPPIARKMVEREKTAQGIRIGVAEDEAFCFTYQDNLLLLERMGAEIVPFSPLGDAGLPKNLHGLILSGGYPELHAERLSANRGMLAALKKAVESGMPTIAECGGFMALCESLATEENGGSFPMAGAVRSTVKMTKRLSHFGYVTMTAEKDNLLAAKGETIRAHEFHYSEASDPGSAFTASKADGREWPCVHGGGSLYAGYPHIHFWGNKTAAERFVEGCRERKRKTM
ncbi:MAG: cobyrinate a,c-diamide synthase [Oscillospiraceae bacterium]